MKNKKIIVAGGTGFIGQALVEFFGKDNRIIILGRQAVTSFNNRYEQKLLTAAEGYNVTYWRWDGIHVESHWAAEVEGADIIINLAGKSVNCRYNEKNKREVFDSRTNSTIALAKAIQQSTVPPKLWINAASATIYRNSTDRAQDEFTGEISDYKKDNMPYSLLDQLRFKWKKCITAIRHGKNSDAYKKLDLDFSVQVCKRWENIFYEQRTPFTRKVALRTAITLGTGGVIVPYFNLLKFGLGGYQGNGKQMYSWVHAEDFCRTVEFLYDHTDMEGTYNCAAPGPVTNNKFMETLRKITGHRFGLPAFDWMIEIGTKLIGSESELILKSRWVLPARLEKSGFTFKYPTLESALKEIVEKTPRQHYHLF